MAFSTICTGQAAPAVQNAASSPTQTPSITTNIDEVSLDLVVHDKGHKVVRDLKNEDLAITDNGVPVTLKGLHLVSSDSSSDHLVTLVFDPFVGPAAKSAQGIAMKILSVLPSNGYSFAVMDIPGRLRLIQGFTDDRNTVRQAVKTVTDSSAVDRKQVIQLTATNTVVKKDVPTAPDQKAVTAEQAEKNLIAVAQTGVDLAGTHMDVKTRARYQTLLNALGAAQQIRQDQHALPNLAGLLAVARSQQKIAARKCIIYFTENMQLDSASKEMVHTITGAANQSGVTLYVVDMDALDVGGRHQIDAAVGAQNVAFNPTPAPAAGSGGHGAAVAPMEQAGATSGPGSNVGMATDWNRQGSVFSDASIKSPLAEMAKDTGGGYVDAQDNVKKPLQQLVEDMTTYYQASYVPPIQDYDGSFRTIDARAVRAGINIKTKTGYFAVAPGAEGGIRPFEAPLLKILGEAQLPTNLQFHASVLQFGELPDGNTSSVAVDVPLSQLQTKTDTHTNLFSAHVSIVAQIKDQSGLVIEHFAEDVAKRGTLDTIDNDKTASITLQRHFPVTPGKYTLEVAVMDRFNDKAGAQRTSFEIPPTTASPSLSDIVLVKKVDTFRDDDDVQEPMRYETGKITPNVTGDIPANTKGVSLFFIVHPDTKTKSPLTIEMIASRNGRPGKRVPLPLRQEAGLSAFPYMASFKSAMAPGDYTIKAIVTQNGKSTEQEASFTVEGMEALAAAPGGSESAAAMAASGMSALPDISTTGALAITAITNPVPPPSPEEAHRIIADARVRALHYIDSLPNFMCVETTKRSFDPTGTGRWKLRDTITELLRYYDKAESRTMIEVNGKSDSTDREAMKGAFSAGELGGVFKAVFLDSAKTEFTWKEVDSLGTGTVQVFSYKVAKANSQFSVVGLNDLQVMVGFHGLVFIDSSTKDVRRITLEADDLPKDFPTHQTSIAVDYDYVQINTHDYMMPISAELRLQQGRHESVRNSIDFQSYRRFGSNVRILPNNPQPEKP
jgi:VWFA-related protein